MEKYDSEPETIAHIKRVQALVAEFANALMILAREHDQSKLSGIERQVFDEFTPKLKGSTYGSEEYKRFLAAMKPALDHHYATNRHHPEHFEDGVFDMDLFDLVEMVCDWKAASERHADGSMEKSIKVNEVRFNLSAQLVAIIKNTRKRMGWE